MTVVDQYGEYLVVLEDEGYRLMTEDGDPVEYEIAPRKARFLLDRKEAERQGQLKLPL